MRVLGSLVACLALASAAKKDRSEKKKNKGANNRQLEVHNDMTHTHWVDHLAHTFGENWKAMQTYIKSDDKGRPATIGVSFATNFDEVFPAEIAAPEVTNRFTFKVDHPCQNAVPFTHIQMNYNPKGHPGGFPSSELMAALGEGRFAEILPSSPYMQRHLDLHFHLDTEEESMQVVCDTFPPCITTAAQEEKFMTFPAADFLPDTFAVDPTSKVPAMGIHHHGAAGETFEYFKKEYAPIMMTYDGMVNAWEVMITIDSLEDITEGRVDEKVYDFPQPKEVQVSGYYPTGVRFALGREHGQTPDTQYVRVEFTGLTFRRAPGSALTEEEVCPAVDCANNSNSDVCGTCGIPRVRFTGRVVEKCKNGGGKTCGDSSCACRDYCAQEEGVDGFAFKRGNSKKNKSGTCWCMTATNNEKRKRKRSFTSGLIA